MIIQTRNLTRCFRGVDAVHGIDLAIPDGATCALIGANGAGKTTTLRMLVNILRPDEGEARILRKDSRQLTAADRQNIAYVAENQILPDRLTVQEYLRYLQAQYVNWDHTLEAQLLKQFGLAPDRAIGKLSHGARMKLMLIGALAFHPKLMILDEPLSGLDPLVRDEVMSGLLTQAGETTILLSSHELEEIEGCITHVAFMAHGKLLLQDDSETLANRFRDVSVTLDPASPARTALPETWINPLQQGPMLRFIDSAYVDDQRLREQIGTHAGTARHVDAAPMSLRDISKALMRATREEA